MPTIAVLMHFVLTRTNLSIAHVNLDLQEMEKTAQVVFSVANVSFILSLCYNLLVIAMQRQWWIQGRWIGRLYSHPPFFSRLTCLLEQFNWHFIPVLSA